MYIKAYTTTADASGAIVTELRDYDKLSGLRFSPSADLSGASLPINEFEADIHTADDIAPGAYAELYDDRDRLWAAYWVSRAERSDAGVLTIRARSPVALLERVTLPAVYYDARDLKDVLDQALSESVGVPYALDPGFDGVTVTGFCPAQTPRERLLWVCFAVGAWVRTCFNARLEILPVGEGVRFIPKRDIYWKPSLRQGDWVTAIRVRAYSFSAGEPQATDEFVVSDTGVRYIVTHRDYTLSNPDAPAVAPENEVAVTGVMLVGEGNAMAVLNRLARWHFSRERAELDAIDNGDYAPGDRVTAALDDARVVTGHVERAEFAFGLQAKAALSLAAAAALPSATLQILYLWGETALARAEYAMPVGYEYAVDNPYFDRTMDGHRYVFRPENARAEGVVADGGSVDRQACLPALDLYEGILHILSVDGVSERAAGSAILGVIS